MDNNAYDYFKSKERMNTEATIEKLLREGFDNDIESFTKYWEEIIKEDTEKLNNANNNNLQYEEIQKLQDGISFAKEAVAYIKSKNAAEEVNPAVVFEQLENEIKQNYERQIEIIKEQRNLANRFASTLENESLSSTERAENLQSINKSFNDLDIENEKLKASIEEKIIQLNNIDANFNLSELKPTSIPYLNYDESEDIYKRIIKGKSRIGADDFLKQNIFDSIELMANINLRSIHAETFNFDKMVEQVEKDLSNENNNLQEVAQSVISENIETPTDNHDIPNPSNNQNDISVEETPTPDIPIAENEITDEDLVKFVLDRITNKDIKYTHKYTMTSNTPEQQKEKQIVKKLTAKKILEYNGGSSFNNEVSDKYNIRYVVVRDFINNYKGNALFEEQRESLKAQIDELIFKEIKDWSDYVRINDPERFENIFKISSEEAKTISERIGGLQESMDNPAKEDEPSQNISESQPEQQNNTTQNDQNQNVPIPEQAQEEKKEEPKITPINNDKLNEAIQRYKSIVDIINSLVASVNSINNEEYTLLSGTKNNMESFISKEQEAVNLTNQILDKKIELSKLEFDFYNQNHYALSLNDEIKATNINVIETNDEFMSFVDSHNQIIDANYEAVKNLTSQVTNATDEMKNAIINEIDKHMAIIDMEKSIISRRAILEKQKNKSFDIINFYKENNYLNRMKQTSNKTNDIEEQTISVETETPTISSEPEAPTIEANQPTEEKNVIKIHKSNLNFNGTQQVNTLKASITRGNLITIKILKDAIRIEYNKYLVDKLNELKLQVQTVASYNQEGQKNVNIGGIQTLDNGKQIQMINNPQELENATISFVDSNNQVVADYNLYGNEAVEEALSGMSK